MRGYPYITGIDFSSDEKQLAISGLPAHGGGGSAKIVELEFDRGIHTLYGLSSRVEKTSFSEDSKLLAALTQDWRLAVYDLDSHSLLWTTDVPAGIYADNSAMVFNSEGTQLAFSAGKTAILWDVATGTVAKQWALPLALQDHLGFHPSGKLLLFRVETNEMDRAPISSAIFSEHPRVCRVRDLLSDNWEKPLFEFDEFNRYVYSAASDHRGTFFIIDGVHHPSNDEGRAVVAIDPLAAKDKILWRMDCVRRRPIERIRVDPTGAYASFYLGSGVDKDGFVPPLIQVVVETHTGKLVDMLVDRSNIAALHDSARGWLLGNASLHTRESNRFLIELEIDDTPGTLRR